MFLKHSGDQNRYAGSGDPSGKAGMMVPTSLWNALK